MPSNELDIENKIKEVLTDVFKDLIINTKQTFELFLKQEKNVSDLIALYDFYYYTAKWQKTNQPKATIKYVMKGLRWGEKKTRDRKQQLVKLGLIQDIKRLDKRKRITGWYIQINYIWGENTILDRVKSTLAIPATLAEKPQGGVFHSVESEGTNALSALNINALSINKNIYMSFKQKINKNSRLTSYAKKKIQARLKEFSGKDLLKAIDNFSKNDWQMKNNSHRGIAWFFASEDRIDSYINTKKSKPSFKIY